MGTVKGKIWPFWIYIMALKRLPVWGGRDLPSTARGLQKLPISQQHHLLGFGSSGTRDFTEVLHP